MKTNRPLPLRALTLLCAAAMTLCALPVLPLPVKADTTYIEPGYAVEFSTMDSIDNCYDVFHITPTEKDGAMEIAFQDTGAGTCFDPYLSLSLDANKYSCEEYPYLALLVKTNKQDLKGQNR